MLLFIAMQLEFVMFVFVVLCVVVYFLCFIYFFGRMTDRDNTVVEMKCLFLCVYNRNNLSVIHCSIVYMINLFIVIRKKSSPNHVGWVGKIQIYSRQYPPPSYQRYHPVFHLLLKKYSG